VKLWSGCGVFLVVNVGLMVVRASVLAGWWSLESSMCGSKMKWIRYSRVVCSDVYM